MATKQDEIILFHYDESIYSHKILWYLHLHGIPYSECIQPGWLPRPDITDGLHVNYRRIPILAIGKDIYCDTRIILDTLERNYSKSSLRLKTPADHGIRKLFENHNMSGGVFWRAASLLPMWKHPFLKDPKFIKDRSDMLGRPFDANVLMQARPEGLSHMRMSFELLETTFLADGRHWVLGHDEGPSLADIDAIYPLQWIIRDKLMEGGTPEEYINATRFPKTIAWIDRFLDAVQKAELMTPKPKTVTSKQAIDQILASKGGAFDTYFEPNEPIDVKLGEMVTVTAIDGGGSSHSDTGMLLTLTVDEICILNDKRLRLHFPRWNFRIESASNDDVSDGMAALSIQPMKLIYHPMSPFSRKAYMFALEVRLAQHISLEKVVVAPIPYPGWSDNNEEVARSNPMAKIPTLVPEEHGDGIYDSRLILEYLQEKAQAKPSESDDQQAKWRLRTLQACADGILDAQVLIIYENKIRAENNIKFDTWIAGQKEKIHRGLDRLELEATRGTLGALKEDEVATAADVTVASALGFMDIVKEEWRSTRPKLSVWFSTWEKRPSFLRTGPDLDWKTGNASGDPFASGVVSGK